MFRKFLVVNYFRPLIKKIIYKMFSMKDGKNLQKEQMETNFNIKRIKKCKRSYIIISINYCLFIIEG